MSEHLSSEQMSEWIIGERSPEAEEHLNRCGVWRDELALFGTAMSLFRNSVRTWTDEERGPDAQTIRRVKRQPYIAAAQNACWAIAVGVLFVVLSMPMMQQHGASGPKPGEPQQVDTASLLTQVNAEVSESVPDAMQPLTQLVSPYQSSVKTR